MKRAREGRAFFAFMIVVLVRGIENKDRERDLACTDADDAASRGTTKGAQSAAEQNSSAAASEGEQPGGWLDAVLRLCRDLDNSVNFFTPVKRQKKQSKRTVAAVNMPRMKNAARVFFHGGYEFTQPGNMHRAVQEYCIDHLQDEHVLKMLWRAFEQVRNEMRPDRFVNDHMLMPNSEGIELLVAEQHECNDCVKRGSVFCFGAHPAFRCTSQSAEKCPCGLPLVKDKECGVFFNNLNLQQGHFGQFKRGLQWTPDDIHRFRDSIRFSEDNRLILISPVVRHKFHGGTNATDVPGVAPCNMGYPATVRPDRMAFDFGDAIL